MKRQYCSFFTIIMLSIGCNIFAADFKKQALIPRGHFPQDRSKEQILRKSLVPMDYFNPEDHAAAIQQAAEEAKRDGFNLTVKLDDNPSAEIEKARRQYAILGSLTINRFYLYRFTEKESLEKADEVKKALLEAAKTRLETIDPNVFITAMENALKDEVQTIGTKQSLIERGAALYKTLQNKKDSFRPLRTEEQEFLRLYNGLLYHKTAIGIAEDLAGHARRLFAEASKKPFLEGTKYVVESTAAYAASRFTHHAQGILKSFGWNPDQRRIK